jgi:TolB protein
VFRDARIVVPAAENFTPYRDYLGAHIEILDLETRNRRIIYSRPEAMQAPNWTLDASALIYNSGGRLYRLDLANSESELIETGEIVGNNNDHVISFDGTMLGISSASPEGEQSVVYTVPIGGGVPTRITTSSPSYLHGW